MDISVCMVNNVEYLMYSFFYEVRYLSLGRNLSLFTPVSIRKRRIYSVLLGKDTEISSEHSNFSKMEINSNVNAKIFG